MRDQSLSLRILVLAVLLPTAAAVCVFALVVSGTLHPRIVHMVAVGGVILIVAILAAAISALGPKYRPTPLLTPLFAGIFAALLATTAIYAVRAHVVPTRKAIAAVETKPAESAPVVDKALVTPALAAMPQEPQPQEPMAQKPTMAPSFDASTFMPPAKAQDQMQADAQPATVEDAQPPPEEPAARGRGGQPGHGRTAG